MRQRPAQGATSTEAVTPENPQRFSGNELSYVDRGSLGPDSAALITPPGSPGGVVPRVERNTTGASGGEVTVWQDGRQVFTQRRVIYRTTDQLKPDSFFRLDSSPRRRAIQQWIHRSRRTTSPTIARKPAFQLLRDGFVRGELDRR